MKVNINTTDCWVYLNSSCNRILTSHFLLTKDKYLIYSIPVSSAKLKDPTGYTFVNFTSIADVNRIIEEDRYILCGDGTLDPSDEKAITGDSPAVKLNQWNRVPITITVGN